MIAIKYFIMSVNVKQRKHNRYRYKVELLLLHNTRNMFDFHFLYIIFCNLYKLKVNIILFN